MVVAVNRIKGLNYANTLYAGDHAGKYCPVYTFDEDSQATVQWHFNPTFLKHVIGEDNLDFLENFESNEGVAGLPEEVLDPIVVRAKKKYWNRISASYGYNHENMPGAGHKPTRPGPTPSVRSPTRPGPAPSSVARTGSPRYSGRFIWESQGYEGKTPDGKIAYRHNNKAIVTYYDGHTELKSMADIRLLDRRGGKNNIFWGGQTQ